MPLSLYNGDNGSGDDNMNVFFSGSCPFKEEEARKKSRCRYIIFARQRKRGNDDERECEIP